MIIAAQPMREKGRVKRALFCDFKYGWIGMSKEEIA